MHARSRLALTLLTALICGPAACASTGERASSGGSYTPTTQEELEDLSDSDAFAAVQRLRPSWLRHRGATSVRNPQPNTPIVYVDGNRRGSLSELRRIAINDVNVIRFVPPRDATTRYGTGHPAGVIEVETRR